METLEASIISEIKVTRSSKKGRTNSPYKNVKNKPQSIANEEIKETLKTLSDLGVTENTP